MRKVNYEPLRRSTSLSRRAAIITGAGNGLGLAIARRLANLGAKVLLVDCDPEVLRRIEAPEFAGTTATALVQDLADADAAAKVFDTAIAELGFVNTLVNNAAWSLHKPMLEMTVADFDRLIAINQRSPFFLAQESYRYHTQGKERVEDPSIVNISSVNALAGNPNLIAYAGTNGALVSMTRAMAVEMAVGGVRVNSISPGAVDTPMTRKVIEQGYLDMTKFFEGFLIKRFATCEEIAELVAYLCSEAAGCVTGANWVIDGGYLAH